MKNHTSSSPDLFSSAERRKLKDAFYKALEDLTPDQLKTVQDIEGPVMVLAGPGTGKTQVLAARFGYILDHTDSNLNQILCLTYSEAGVVAMRDRLNQFIGPAANEAHIYTFHEFCYKLIQENAEYFFDFKKFKLASDLQRFELIETILDELPDDNRVKRILGDKHFDVKRMDRQYGTIKREEKDPELIINQTLKFIDAMQFQEEYINKKTGALKKNYIEDRGKFERSIDALKTFNIYKEKMHAHQWIDFNDMLLEVQTAFKKFPDLLSKYQEQYLYFLVDEYQDTNAIQNNILLTLCNFWPSPNLFVVGDDDQAIYRFQGANEQNLLTLFRTYPAIEVYCITDNFRSTQIILDASNHLIDKLETGRIQQQLFEIPPATLSKINKKLIAGIDHAEQTPPKLLAYIHSAHETLAIFNYIKDLYDKKQNLDETAIICRRFNSVQDLIYLLELAGIPIQLRVGKNVLDQPFIRHIILLLTYLEAEYQQAYSGEPLLIPLMLLPYWNLEPDDVALITYLERKNKQDKFLADKIMNPDCWPEANFKNRAALEKFVLKTKEWKKQLPPVKTMTTILDDLLRESGLLQWAIQSPDRSWHLRCLNSLLNYVVNLQKNDATFTLSGLLEHLKKMENFEVPINIDSGYSNEKGVHLITAHGAKGQEFERVWICNASNGEWEEYNAGADTAYKLPRDVFQLDQIKDNKKYDERRLFYVAMTRAKKELIISYPVKNEKENDARPSVFMTDLQSYLKTDIPLLSVDESLLMEKMKLIQNKETTPEELINKALVAEFNKDFVMSATDLNVYLDCPRKFYFETILKVPRSDNAHKGLGIALHESLHEFFHLSLKNDHLDPDVLVDLFLQSLKRNDWYFTVDEYNGLIRKFTKQLPQFLAQNKEIWKTHSNYKLEYYIDRTNFEGIPIHGKIDQVISKGDHSIIIDFKSGQGDSSGAKRKLPPPSNRSKGGEYWRQGAFYKILLDLDKSFRWNVKSANVIFLQTNKLEPERFEIKEYTYTTEQLLLMAQLIKDTYEKIKLGEFYSGCNDDDCEWCTYVKDREVIKRSDAPTA